MDKCVDMAAIVDESQRKSIAEYVEGAREEGADVFQVPTLYFDDRCLRIASDRKLD